MGAPDVRIGLWDDASKRLLFQMDDKQIEIDPRESVLGQALESQRAVFTENSRRDSPKYGPLQRTYGGVAVLVAPITAGEKRLGVLAFTPREHPSSPRRTSRWYSSLRRPGSGHPREQGAHRRGGTCAGTEEITRLKEDFLSAAAHDLKTPLTTLVMQTELLERRALRSPTRPPTWQVSRG